MCSQFDTLHDEVPADAPSSRPSGERRSERRETRPPGPGASAAAPGAAGTPSRTDELTLRMMFGVRAGQNTNRPTGRVRCSLALADRSRP